MSTPRLPIRLASIALLLPLAQAAPSAAQTAARPDNFYAAGNRVVISTPMPADVLVAGREIEIRQPIAGDVLAAAWRFELTAKAEDDVRVAGSDVSINAPVNGDVTIAGGSVRFGPETTVSGRGWITGRSVRINGVFERELNVAAAEVVIDGEVRQSARIVAERLDIGPNARLLAPVTYRGANEATIAKGATVTGPFTFTHIDAREARRERAAPAVSTFLFTVHLFLAGLLVIVFLPRTERSVIATLRAQPLKSLLAGVALLITVPVAALFLILTVLGLPIGLLLAATYATALFAGVLTSAFFLGDAEARWLRAQAERTRGQEAMMLLAGVLTLAVLRVVLGGVAVFVAVLFGLGALSVWLYQSYVRATRAPATV